MPHFDNQAPRLSSGEIAEIIRLGVEAEHLARMPQGTLPVEIILAAPLKEFEHGDHQCLPGTEQRLRAPRPLFRTDWGLLEMREVDAFKDRPAFLSVVVYLDEAINDIDFGVCIGAYLPEFLLNLATPYAVERLRLEFLPGQSDMAGAEMIFLYDGADGEIADRKVEIAKFLAEFVGSGALERAIERVTVPLERYQLTLLLDQDARPGFFTRTRNRLLQIWRPTRPVLP
jgi:hypothetical protein